MNDKETLEEVAQIGVNIAYNCVKPDYTEITFEQF